MPKRLETIEARRRRLRRPVYIVQPVSAGEAGASSPLSTSHQDGAALTTWLQGQMPDVKVDLVGGSEFSFAKLDATVYSAIDLSPEQLREYLEHWECPHSVDASGRRRDVQHGFALLELEYDGWRKQLSECEVFSDPPAEGVDRFVFWDTPTEGLIWAPWASGDSYEPWLDPRCSADDLWIRAQELLPSRTQH